LVRETTYPVPAPIVAALAARVPRKTLLLGGLAVFVIANLATAVVPTFAPALATRAIAGLGAAMFGPDGDRLRSHDRSTRKSGIRYLSGDRRFDGPTALGAPIGALIGSLGDWRWTMVFVAALGPPLVSALP
jgi:predicted MFS family arabinose efflux permease